MSGPLVSASAAFVAKNSRIPPYAIEQSLRFDGTNTLTRTFTGTARTTLTISGWVKLGQNHNYGSNLLFYGTGGGGNTQAGLGYGANNGFYVPQLDQTGGSYENATHLDFSAWLHVVYTRNGTSSHTLYINGAESPMTNGGTGSLPNSWLTGPGVINNPNGYVAELHVVDGSNLNQYDFGEFDDNGVWRPIEYTGSHGTNGFYLKFDPSATNGIGHDHSGNGNHWTAAAGFVTSGTGTDVMSDTPTTNYATLNPLSKTTDAALSEGNLKVTFSGASGEEAAVSSIVMASKTYWEVTDQTAAISTYGNCAFGIAGVTTPLTQSINSSGIICFINYNGNFYRNGTLNPSGSGAPFGAGSTNDVYMFAYDPATTSLWAGRNGTWFNSGNPASGTGAISTVNIGDVVAYISGYQSGDGPATANFGQRAFAYTPPTGFKALNTSNLPAPTIKDGSSYFNTVLYTGNGSTQSITGVGFQPDWVWIKSRSAANSHGLFDAVRGVQNELNTNSTSAEGTGLSGVTSFDLDGFSLGSRANENQSSATFAAWNWLAGNGTSSNTDGSITSTVSANPTAGFSIVNFTGTGANATVGHGLGVAPDLLILKNRDDGLQDWPVYHSALGATKQLVLSSTAAASTNSVYWNNTEPTSTVFTVGTAGNTNGSGDKTIAYCFAEVEGYSKFGSYTGNGSTDGPFVYCGFKPAFVLTKDTTAHNWEIIDNVRDTYNVANKRLFTSVSNAEDSSVNTFDFLSNGFKVRGTHGGNNTSGNTHIFMAFAENPFGGSGVSPATAR